MDTSVYTLLIVESPTIAGMIQQMCPPSVYVLSTEGYCWRPTYDTESHQIKAIADPAKQKIRKELKEQSKIANTIVVAVDSDASGDFITWSVSRFIKSSNVKRAQLQGLSRSGIYSMLSNTTELDESQLETRLKNRFMVRHLWSKYSDIPDLQFAGLISVFGANNRFQTFLDQNDSLYQSSNPIQCNFDEWISVRPDTQKKQYRSSKPLSTFDVIEFLVDQPEVISGHDSQLLLNQLFQTILPFTEESLISYPRTAARAFYSETWTHLRKQYLMRSSVNDLKPTYLQEIADSETPHESIHPLDLSLNPDSVTGELSKDIGELYRWIYEQTIKSLSMPEPVEGTLVSDLNPDVVFFPDTHLQKKPAESIRPCLLLSDLGIQLHEIGVLKPSGFGTSMDEWVSKNWIQINGRIVSPARRLLEKMDKAPSIRNKLMELNRLKEDLTLLPEAVVNVLTS